MEQVNGWTQVVPQNYVSTLIFFMEVLQLNLFLVCLEKCSQDFWDEKAFGWTNEYCLHYYLEIQIKYEAHHNLLSRVHQFGNKYK